jgi:hypothetical protein
MSRFCEINQTSTFMRGRQDETVTMLGDLLEATSYPFGKTCFHEVRLAMLLEAFSVKSVLEMLEGKSEVEDIHVCG